MSQENSERWNAYDATGQLLEGRVIERDKFPDGDVYHLAVNVWVQHTDGDFLFVQRSKDKSHYPLYFEAGAGGSVFYGETALEAARRELQEETGFTAHQLTRLFFFTEEEHHTHFEVFLAEVTGDKNSLVYQVGETQDHRWVVPEEVPQFLERQLVFTNQKAQLLEYLAHQEK